MANIKFAGKWQSTIDDLQKSFYNSEMTLQDKELPQININTPQKPFLNVSTEDAPPKELINKLQTFLGPNLAVPVQNVFLENKTPEEYQQYKKGDAEAFGRLLPGLANSIGKRIYKFGEQFVDNIPGLSSFSYATKDKSDDIAGAAIQAGGRVLPVLGAAWFGLNAGATAAGTLDEARKKNLIK